MAANVHSNRPKNQGGFGNCGTVNCNYGLVPKGKSDAVLALPVST